MAAQTAPTPADVAADLRALRLAAMLDALDRHARTCDANAAKMEHCGFHSVAAVHRAHAAETRGRIATLTD